MSLLLYLLMTAGPVSLENRDAAPKSHTAKVEVLKTGHLRIKVMINGKGPFPLVFDTGAPVNLVSNKLGKECDLKKKPGRSGVTFLGPMGEAEIESLSWGGAKVTKVPVMVMDHPTIKVMAQYFGPIEGIVGFPFFAKFKMVLNYQKSEATLEPNGFVPEDLFQGAITRFMVAEKTLTNPVQKPFGLLFESQPSESPPGLVVKEVVAGSRAASAGLRKGDILTSLNGRWTDQHVELYRVLGDIRTKDPVSLEIQRNKETLILKIPDLLGLGND